MASAQTFEEVEKIRGEIDRLTEEQAEFLRTATYLGMTPDEARGYDERGGHITSLIRELERMEKAL